MLSSVARRRTLMSEIPCSQLVGCDLRVVGELRLRLRPLDELFQPDPQRSWLPVGQVLLQKGVVCPVVTDITDPIIAGNRHRTRASPGIPETACKVNQPRGVSAADIDQHR